MKPAPPHLAARYLRTGARRFVRNLLTSAYRPQSGWCPPPVLVVLNPTRDCNLRCAMCFDRGQDRAVAEWGAPDREKELTVADYRAILAALAPATPTFYITGGEPLVSEKTLPILRAIKSHGAYVSMNTNGVLLEEHAAALVDAGLDKLIVSVDGPRDIHNAIRGDTFDRIAAGIARVTHCKADKGTRRPAIRMQCVISSHNAGSLRRAAEAARELGVEEIRFQHLMFTFPEGATSPSTALRGLVAQGRASRPRLAPDTLDVDVLRNELDALRRRRPPPRIRFEPTLRARDLAGYYGNPRHPFRDDCLSPWRRLVISDRGGLGPCQGMVLEHYPDRGVLDAWHGAAFRRLRAHIRKTGLFPHCIRCCHREYYRNGPGLAVQ